MLYYLEHGMNLLFVMKLTIDEAVVTFLRTEFLYPAEECFGEWAEHKLFVTFIALYHFVSVIVFLA